MLVTVERDGNVAVVTMNRPEAMNALSSALREELAKAMVAVDADDSIHAVVLTGAGQRAFTAGLDLKELGAQGLGAANAETAQANPVKAIEQCRKPVIGAINGVAITGGFEVAVACDILIASENARFADTHARVGIMPGWGLSQKLSRLIGISRAKELSLSGNFLDAQTACAWGLVNRVVPAEELLPAAKKLAADIASADPGMIQAYKRLIDDGYAVPFGEAMALEHERSSSANSKVNKAEVEARRMAVMERGRAQQASNHLQPVRVERRRELGLTIPEIRRAFFHEGVAGLQRIRGLRKQDLLAVLQAKGVFHAGRIDVQVQRVLGQAQAHRAGQQHFIGQSQGLAQQFLMRDNLAHQAAGQRLVRVHELAGQQVFAGDRAADQTRQEIAGPHVAAAQANLDIGRVHPQVGRGIAHIAGQQEREAAAAGRSLCTGDDRLRALAHGLHHGCNHPLGAPSGMDRAGIAVALPAGQVQSGAERAALCPQLDHAHFVAVMEAGEIVQQRLDQRLVHGVEPVRTVERDDFDRAPVLDDDRLLLCLIGHILLPFSVWFGPLTYPDRTLQEEAGLQALLCVVTGLAALLAMPRHPSQ